MTVTAFMQHAGSLPAREPNGVVTEFASVAAAVKAIRSAGVAKDPRNSSSCEDGEEEH